MKIKKKNDERNLMKQTPSINENSQKIMRKNSKLLSEKGLAKTITRLSRPLKKDQKSFLERKKAEIDKQQDFSFKPTISKESQKMVGRQIKLKHY